MKMGKQLLSIGNFIFLLLIMMSSSKDELYILTLVQQDLGALDGIEVGSDDETIVDLNIFHTNDIHGGVDENIGFAKFKHFINLANEYTRAEGYLVLDAGDIFHGTPFATVELGESVAQVLKVVGYDAMSPGNHDFNYGQDRLVELGKVADVELLAANVKTIEGKLRYGDCFVKEIGGMSVGLFGLTTPETVTKTNPENVVGLTFGTEEEIVAEAKLMVQVLQERGVDVIIGLMHMGIDTDSRIKSTTIASQVDDIDLIIDGHSHSELNQYEIVNGTILTSTGEHFKNVGVVTIQYDLMADEIIKLVPHQISMKQLEKCEEDTEVKSVIDRIKNNQKSILEEVIGTTAIKLEGGRSSVLNGHTNLGHLLTAAMLNETQADISLINGGTIRDSIDVGMITKGDVLKVLPFSNHIVTVEMTGKQLIEILNKGLVIGSGRFLHFAGLLVEAKLVQEAGCPDRYEVLSVQFNQQPLELTQTYVVAMNDFMVAGGDDYQMSQSSNLLNSFGTLDEALISYVKEYGEIAILNANQINNLIILTEEDMLSDENKVNH
ncbi:bifunctional metallophosphatase/5'-nucleotidase [Turicibacter sanguinis]|uniref:Bifunctional metallophosphatase/5'-nucleotidase n=3 Tax=Turicibacteraceae TaxID=2810281 RepID=A0A6G2CBF4_9FIRM|nr:bifunctional UDP-sugar hydrolase/5'-nucleotidase [Turicibacter sanguinis]MBP3904930.1 bifunctional metallophosphatase/5'-nucleotidase [Turicibacter sp.]EFF64535.1 5'-nucleotidase, C-terminal domain protein [Turicibacter sanguinis PC909]MDB8437067.1 bifunctional UDP-sugar hydrolase/5'-nucleotidase [Turicibacter sanguinis]MDB8459021.1 bifunctional UDP-sugar hydrolase/5'-nucleotidase [Turicibacter sanguinis]MTK20448.1 bifunctional metallophosphatase/5'-nucleotidase [Turicibacter sanguinis]